MTEPADISVGTFVFYGVDHPRKVEVIGEPYRDGSRWLVPVQFATGERKDVMLTLIRVHKKRPSARRKTTLKGIVDCFNEGLDEDSRISPELLEDKMRRFGIR